LFEEITRSRYAILLDNKESRGMERKEKNYKLEKKKTP